MRPGHVRACGRRRCANGIHRSGSRDGSKPGSPRLWHDAGNAHPGPTLLCEPGAGPGTSGDAREWWCRRDNRRRSSERHRAGMRLRQGRRRRSLPGQAALDQPPALGSSPLEQARAAASCTQAPYRGCAQTPPWWPREPRRRVETNRPTDSPFTEGNDRKSLVERCQRQGEKARKPLFETRYTTAGYNSQRQPK